ncbi:hypothetical protein Nizo3400_2614 [Lactiplantibacillus plantarum]|nr:hypothetical protein Nizo3400_2614 [Lactiplantibacillus plantarum]
MVQAPDTRSPLILINDSELFKPIQSEILQLKLVSQTPLPQS